MFVETPFSAIPQIQLEPLLHPYSPRSDRRNFPQFGKIFRELGPANLVEVHGDPPILRTLQRISIHEFTQFSYPDYSRRRVNSAEVTPVSAGVSPAPWKNLSFRRRHGCLWSTAASTTFRVTSRPIIRTTTTNPTCTLAPSPKM